MSEEPDQTPAFEFGLEKEAMLKMKIQSPKPSVNKAKDWLELVIFLYTVMMVLVVVMVLSGLVSHLILSSQLTAVLKAARSPDSFAFESARG